MTQLLLLFSAALFVFWLIGLAGSWAGGLAWTLFVSAAVLFCIWLVVTSAGRRRVMT